MKKILFSILSLCFVFTAKAQLVYTEPIFPTVDAPVTIFFDATQGSGGLANCNCDVYLHTGVITSESTGNSDWKHVVTAWGVANDTYKMTQLSDNLYSYTINDILDFYNISEGEEVLRLAFVFRNANGTLEGKDVGGTDIFVDLYPVGLHVKFANPTAYENFEEPNQSITIAAEATQAATMSLYQDGVLLATAENETQLSYNITTPASGKLRLKMTAENANGFAEDSITIVVKSATQTAELPENMEDGINYLSESSVLLSLYAPGKDFIYVVGDFSNWETEPNLQMKRTPDGNRFWVQIDNLTPQQEYAFQYFIDGSLKVTDPYVELVLDPSNDNYITADVYPNLKPYPNGKTTGIVGVLQTAAPEYVWETTNFEAPPAENLVIYELLLRDFVHAHNYNALKDTLNYLQSLGVNAIELMPIMEFEGNISWGYNPSFMLAPDKYYGTKNMLKSFIDECHSRGIAVILDIVLNHQFGQSPLAQMYFEGSAPSANSPWFNVTAKHDFNVGYDLNHESPATQYFAERVMKHWIEEYNIDGYRFDLSKGFTQTNTLGNTSAWGQYDASRIAIWENYGNYMWSLKPNFHIILEHFAVNTEEKELADNGFMLWGNETYKFGQAGIGFVNGTNFDYAYYKVRNFNEPHLVAYMESHDEERLMYKCTSDGLADGGYDIKLEEVALERMKLLANFYFAIPGPKMIWQFGELGYDYSINYNGRTGPKPIRWDYFTDERRQKVYQVYSAMSFLRENYPTFTEGTATLATGSSVKKITLLHEAMDAFVVGNFSIATKEETISFPHAGTWYEFYSGDSLEIADVGTTLALNHGEFRLYTTEKLPTPPAGLQDLTVYSPTITAEEIGFACYPNPVQSQIQLSWTQASTTPTQIVLYNAQGQEIALLLVENMSAGKQIHDFDLSKYHLAAGNYFIKIANKDFYLVEKIVVMP
ncbi:MAG: alpha-amylase family glycosyl hydrolase [Chitinophagales bacterium]|nr:T9SS type A sorting domain-containing protein [Bacteroidota bacterium]MCB9043041.1 T9SS type A sorting domain-containing protein [Chitinophagales bacterium]